MISRIKDISSSPICLILKNTQATIRSCRLSLTRSPICVDLSMRLRNLLILSLIATTMARAVAKDLVAVANVTVTTPRYRAGLC